MAFSFPKLDGEIARARQRERLQAKVNDAGRAEQRLQEQCTAARASPDRDADTTAPAGKLIPSVMTGVAEFERGRICEHQREDIEAAKEAGKFTGRRPSFSAE